MVRNPHTLFFVITISAALPLSVEKELHTMYEATSISNIKHLLKRYDLKYRKIRNLEGAIDDGHPVLISTYKWWHYSVVYGYSKVHYFVMIPSLGDMGSLSCAVKKVDFMKIWDKWALEIF